MTKLKIAGCVLLPLLAACWSDAPSLVAAPPERTAPSTRVQEVVEAEPVASEPELGCAELPSWRPYSTVPLMYRPPCRFGEMLRVRAPKKTLTEELEEARAENTALHERLREMAEYEARMGVQ